MAVTDDFLSLLNFMTPAEVITMAFTNKNTDPTLITKQMLDVAEIAHIMEPLGRDYYIELKTTFDAGTQTADESILMEKYIKPTLAFYTLFEMILVIQNQSTSSGIVTNMPEFSAPVTPAQLNVFKQDTYRKAKVMTGTLVAFLQENTSEFTGYGGGSSNLCDKSSSAIKTHGMIIY